MFGKKRAAADRQHHRDSSSATHDSRFDGPAPVSPLQMTFDFELQPPSIPDDWRPSVDAPRPQTSDGHFDHGRNSSVVSNGYESSRADNTTQAQPPGPTQHESARFLGTTGKGASRPQYVAKVPSFSRPSYSTGPRYFETQEPSGAPRYSNGDTPAISQKPVAPAAPSQSSFDQQFSRSNLPYVAQSDFTRRGSADAVAFDPPMRPFAALSTLASHSTPDLLSTLGGSQPGGYGAQLFHSPQTTSSHAFTGKSSKLQEHPKHFSGLPHYASQERPMLGLQTRRPSSHRLNDSTPQSATIGTPYEHTSPIFPAPRPVATRPKLGQESVTLAGVTVPTHHSSASSSQSEALKPEKSEKRKTRLLSPFALLSRRRTAQNEESFSKERAAQEQALARQKDVAAVGVSKLPEGFDPRIKGKVVHDFSAPRRTQRNVSYGGPDSRANDSPSSLGSAPILSAYTDSESFSATALAPSPEPPRRTSHVPVFMEHLAENPDHTRRVSSIHAEHLENKDFLQRASFVSTVSALSQDIYALPPFARRSQQLDPARVSYISDLDAQQSPERASEKERSSNASSYGVNSGPARFSTAQSSDGRQSAVSAVSLSNTGMSSQPPLENAERLPSWDLSPKRDQDYPAAQTSSFITPAFSATYVDEREPNDQFSSNRSSSLPQFVPRSSLRQSASEDDANVQQRLQSPDGAMANTAQSTSIFTDDALKLPNPNEATDSTLFSPSADSPQETPEIKTAEFAAAPVKTQPATPAKLVEKRPSAVGHSKRVSRVIKHRASNASRFSFQFGGSAAEERALEEKHHRMAEIAGIPKPSSPLALEDDEDDYFDEDAMDDLDEMEVQNANDVDLSSFNSTTMFMPPAPPSMSQARAQLQSDSESDSDDDVGGVYGVESYNNKIRPDSSLTDTSGRNIEFARSRAAFYMQPQAINHLPGNAPSTSAQDALPTQPRDSGNGTAGDPGVKAIHRSTQNFVAYQTGAVDPHAAPNAESSQRNLQNGDQPRDESHTIAQSQHISTGLGLKMNSNLSGFTFDATPASSRPQSTQMDRLAFAKGGQIQQTNLSLPKYPEDEMYFDDGGADFDVNDQDFGETIDEANFDDDSFLARQPAEPQQETPRRSVPITSRPRDTFTFPSKVGPYPSLGIPQNDGPNSSFPMPSSDGPYPSFAVPNPARAKQRESQMLLENLPLQDTLRDGQLLPQHLPSGEASRPEFGNHVPHFPTPGNNLPAVPHASASLNAYHAALANAANRAADEGRFQRLPSTSTTKSASAYSWTARNDDPSLVSKYDLSHYSREDDGGYDTGNAVDRNVSGRTVDSQTHRSIGYSPSKSSFDFGFDDSQSLVPQDSFGPGTDGVNDYDDDYDYDFDDADMIAAANSEALASDDDGFYGQEFGFYAKARPSGNSALEAINGGFFGEAGDDGLTRNRSTKEPNLTPITERSEFSARNSFIGSLNLPGTSPHPRLSVSTLFEGEVTSFEELRRLRANAFGGSNASISSDGTRGSPRSASALIGSSLPFSSEAMTWNYSNGSSGSSNPPLASTAPPIPPRSRDGPPPASPLQPIDPDATPRKPQPLPSAGKPVVGHHRASSSGVTVPRIQTNTSHSRKSSGGGDSVTYVSEQENGRQRWVMERRRPSEHGQMELVGREVVQGGWI